jgi:Fe-S-cluster containining protein
LDVRPGWEKRGDARLLRVVDAALAEGAGRAGDRLACRVGCTECCHAPFPITLLDARRLAHGLQALREREPTRAAAVEKRARSALRALRRAFPGDPDTGRLSEDEAAREAFFERHHARPCPALDPRTGGCELYAARPLSCRTYGPPLRLAGEDLPACRLCFVDAAPREIARCRVRVDAEGLEDRLLRRLYRSGEPAAVETIVAFALRPEPASCAAPRRTRPRSAGRRAAARRT